MVLVRPTDHSKAVSQRPGTAGHGRGWLRRFDAAIQKSGKREHRLLGSEHVLLRLVSGQDCIAGRVQLHAGVANAVQHACSPSLTRARSCYGGESVSRLQRASANESPPRSVQSSMRQSCTQPEVSDKRPRQPT